MTTILSEGVKVPDVGSVNWAGDLEVNWNLLNGALANLSSNVKLDRDNIWTGEQSFTLPIVGSITGTASRAIADEDGTSIKTGYVNVAGNQTVTGDKSFTGSNTFNNILPNATNTYALGSSSYQWSSVYAQTYYYNGTQWGLDRDNTWTGVNTFSKDNLYIQTEYTLGTVPQTEDAPALLTGRTTDSNFVTGMYFYQSPTRGTGLRLTVRNKWDNNGYSTTGTTRNAHFEFLQGADRIAYTQWSGYVNNGLYPLVNNNYDLGTSTNKWKSLNGINPGALSLPDASNAVSIDTTNVSLNGTYTYLSVSVNGWLYVTLRDTTCNADGELTFFIGDSGTTSSSSRWATNFKCSTDGYVRCFIPVLAGNRIRVRVNPNGGSPTSLTMTIYPCLGNV